MPRVTTSIAAFNGGEWSPRLHARTDLAKYVSAVSECRNFIPLVAGAITKRPGTRHIAPTRRGQVARLIPFTFSAAQSFVLEFTPNWIRFYLRDSAGSLGQLVEAPKAISGVSTGTPVVVTATAHGYAVGNEVVLGGLEGMPALNGMRFQVIAITTNSFSLGHHVTGAPIDGSGVGTYGGGGQVQRVYEVSTTYTADELATLRYAQSADVMYLFHGAHTPRRLTRTNTYNWTLVNFVPIDGPFMGENYTDTTVTLVPVSGSVMRLQFSSVGGIDGGLGFSASKDIGRLVRVLTKVNSIDGPNVYYGWGTIKITSVLSTTAVQGTILTEFLDLVAAFGKRYQFGAWSDGLGYPAIGAFYQQRLWTARSKRQPNSVWASVINNFESFAPSDDSANGVAFVIPQPAPDHSISMTISEDQINQVNWLAPLEALGVGTVGGEKTIQASTLKEGIGPDNATILPASNVGAAEAEPARVDGAALFIGASTQSLHEMAYDLTSDAFRSPDVSLLAEHLTRYGMQEIVFHRHPWQVAWVRRRDGLLLGFTYNREQQVLAWHRHDIAGRDAKVLSLAISPTVAGPEDLYLCVERTINGGTVRCVEVLGSEFWASVDEDKKAAFFVDAGVTIDVGAGNPPVSAITGLHHLEGEEVAILADGAQQARRTVVGGRVELAAAASTIQLGLPISSVLTTLNIEPATADGHPRGRRKSVDAIYLWLVQSLGGSVAFEGQRGQRLAFRSADHPMDSSPPLYTGVKRVVRPATGDQELRLSIMHDDPLPFTLSALEMRATVND